ncbi:hypothetical protein [Lentzea sp. NBRC 102530]|uniref:hypothetical protein n=1 Tax=Lentzea sp. NBRC 102530 TaxID=3032201 RepID=UPI0024A33BFC|nr:hypothetical protein [Lentzea sp. NBRC 102530]GLY54865.1 hypothetical protein Lesp01_85200 [Lentzea sp. NBRC 102530]
MDSEASDYFKVTIQAIDDYDSAPAELEVSHSPDEEENGPENGIGLAWTLPARKRFESVHLAPDATERLRDALDVNDDAKVTIQATDDYDDTPAELEVSHYPDEDGIQLALTLPERAEAERFESVHLAPDAVQRLRDALAAALAYRLSQSADLQS